MSKRFKVMVVSGVSSDIRWHVVDTDTPACKSVSDNMSYSDAECLSVDLNLMDDKGYLYSEKTKT